MSTRIKTRLWDERPDPRSPFAGQSVRLAGFDYYGDLLGQAGWTDTVWLLFTGEAPTREQRTLFEHLAVALANPGPRDPSVHAAMSSGIGGSPAAASLMAALAVAAGDHGGSGELVRAMHAWQAASDDPAGLSAALAAQADDAGIWPGFAAHLHHTPPTVHQCLNALCRAPLSVRLNRLQAAEPALSAQCHRGLSLIGVAAAAFVDLGLSPTQAEALHLLLRLPGALAHALEQSTQSYRDFPFFSLTEAAPERSHG